MDGMAECSTSCFDAPPTLVDKRLPQCNLSRRDLPSGTKLWWAKDLYGSPTPSVRRSFPKGENDTAPAKTPRIHGTVDGEVRLVCICNG
jgi:hypothetical protein